MYRLFIKRLTASDLGWFSACREAGSSAGRQYGLNIDSQVVHQLFADYFNDGNPSSLKVNIHYRPLTTEHRSETHLLRHQSKNWRLTGSIKDECYSCLKPGDFIVMWFLNIGKTQRHYLIWDVAYSGSSDERGSLYKYLSENFKDNQLVVDNEICEKVRDLASRFNPCLTNCLGDGFDPELEVHKALASRHILSEIMSTVVTLSSKTQIEYIKILENLVARFRDLLQNDIETIDLNHPNTWQRVSGERIRFIDGGMAAISSLGSEPIAVRVGTYTVTPGDTSEERERFSMASQLVDELFGDNGVYDEFSDNDSKLRDMARICSEAGAAYKAISSDESLNYIFLHGPLVNPVAPYASYPSFTQKMLDIHGVSKQDIETVVEGIPNGSVTHFISLYLYLLKTIFSVDIPVIGVIERSAASRIVSFTILDRLEDKGYTSEAKMYRELMIDNKITDSILFSCVLREGEYLKPVAIDKNGLHKSPDDWKPVIRNYPKPLTTYIKTTDTSFPFRVEMHPGKQDIKNIMELVFHMARLLPKYSFPVGLDIVDKFAKVPAWMSRQVSKEQSIQLLKTAMASGQQEVVDLVRLYLSGNTRDWLFRPGFDR